MEEVLYLLGSEFCDWKRVAKLLKIIFDLPCSYRIDLVFCLLLIKTHYFFQGIYSKITQMPSRKGIRRICCLKILQNSTLL